jgi:hypothetical protein
MNLTHHAELRSAQRSISEDEMLILLGIGMEIEQKGGTSIITLARDEAEKWIAELKVVLNVLNIMRPDKCFKASYRRKCKAVKRLISHLQSEHLRYFVINQEKNTVITCGHMSARLRRNY